MKKTKPLGASGITDSGGKGARTAHIFLVWLIAISFASCTALPGLIDLAGRNSPPQTVQARPTSEPAPPTSQKQNTTNVRFKTRHIPVPGSSPTNSREFPYMEILAEHAEPPFFSETSVLASNCLPTLNPASQNSGAVPKFNTAEFRTLVNFGIEAARAEFVLTFYRQRHETQSGYLSRLERERQARLASLTPQMRIQAEANERKTAQQNKLWEQRGIAQINLTLAEMIERHRSNDALIQKEQVRVYELATTYHAGLRRLADDLLVQAMQSRGDQSDISRLKEFSLDYERAIVPCRQRLRDGQTLSIWTEFEDRVTQLAMSVYVKNQVSIASTIRSAGSRTEMHLALARQVGSSVLVNLATSVPSIAAAAAEQIARFDAAEAATRRQQAAAAEAAKARAALELRQENLKKAAMNAAPTGPEIAELFTTYLISNSLQAKSLGTIERTGARSFDDFFATGPFQDKRRGSTSVEIDDVRCTPTGGRQVCTYSELLTFRWWRFGFIETYPPPIRGTGKSVFFWTEHGLQSPNLQGSVGSTGYSFKSRDDQSSSSSDRGSSSDSIGERARDESEARELRQQDARRAWEQDQESRRQRNRSCGPAPNICN